MSDYMGNASRALVDMLRGKKDSAALGPMSYGVDQNGHAFDNSGGETAKSRLNKVLQPMIGQPKTETMEERQMREMGL